MSETDLSRAIRQALTALGYWVIRVQSGMLTVLYGRRKHFVHCAEPGTPDLLLPALGLWLEVKTPKGKLSPEQKAWHARAKREGVAVDVVRSVREAVQIAGCARLRPKAEAG